MRQDFRGFEPASRAAAVAVALAAIVLACGSPAPVSPRALESPSPSASAATDDALDELRRDARALEPLATTKLSRDFLAATATQPHVASRVLWVDPGSRRAWTETEAAKLAPDARAILERKELDATYYWETRYGSPLSYLRVVEVLAHAGVDDVAGKRVVDFGYGTVGQLRLLATLGAEATGVDVDPTLPVLYSWPGDQGAVGRGRVSLVSGRWPADSAARASVGARVDVFVSKNTLKRGYVHPALAVNPGRHFDLGVDDATFLAALRDAVVPGGVVLVYNVCPAPARRGEPYIPWSDGRSPFDRPAWEAGGFEVVDFDRDDTSALRAVAHVLRWDQGDDAVDIDHDIFATYTLARRRP
jgi:hypothetical protein